MTIRVSTVRSTNFKFKCYFVLYKIAMIKKYILLALMGTSLTAQAQKDLLVSWTSKNIHYAQDARPDIARATTDTTITVWKGERAGISAIIYSSTNLGNTRVRLTEWKNGKHIVNASQGMARFINYVTTDNYQYCGYHPTTLAPYQVADVIDHDVAHPLTEGTAHPVWCTLEVPQELEAGRYDTRLQVVDAQTNKTLRELRLHINVVNRQLPSPSEQQVHVDFWQQPYAVSRYAGVERWSQAHIDSLKPYLRLLARSGQKVVSAILFYEPWGDQSHDKFSPMVQTTKCRDGAWHYDYSVFDRWVSLCEECGISKQINCFSMVPWDMSFRYYDETLQRDVDLKTTTSSAEYKELWTAFLKDFAAHLKRKGWYDKTCIAMDERGLGNMLDAYRVAQEAVPGMKMALAGSYHKELVDKLYDYCIGYGEAFSPEELAARKAKGWVSTTYTCCSNTEPNLFSNSLPAEAAFLPVYCVANGFEGYLHWSWMNWNDQPLTDTRFRLFAPGDTYLIYPGARSSVRYERFIEGVAMAEKIRILRQEYEQQGDTEALSRLNAIVKEFAPVGIPEGKTAGELVDRLQEVISKK